MAQFNDAQKKWADQFLKNSGGNGATDPASPGTPGMGGMDPTQGGPQALTVGQVIGPATKVGKAILKWANEQGVTTIIIENRSSKDLTLHTDKSLQKLHYPKDARWDRMAPPKIAAKGKDKITVKTKMLIRGVTRATTSGEVVYEIAGEKKGIVKVAWVRKGDGIAAQSDSWSTESGKYSLTGHQSKDGEFTFFFEDVPQPTTPPVPQPPADPNKDQQSGGGKDSKSAPPADTFVLFKQGKFELTSEARSRLHDYAVAYLASKSTAKIDLDGYASIEGVESSNKTLSFDRAEAVFNFLVDKEKVPKDSIQWDGHGVTSDFDPDKKKLEPNRRVTLKLK